MPDRSSASTQNWLPRHLATRLAGRLARARLGAGTRWAIRRFIAHYGVAMDEAELPDVAGYATFNDFFTRALRPGARPLADVDYVCPVDGAISAFGAIDGDRIFQAKGHEYSVQSLLAGDAGLARDFLEGQFATLYLSPRDYHRVHMPCAGWLKRMIHVPGSLYSVNPKSAAQIPGLFARNERLICAFETARGPMAMVLVGATIVGSIATAWHGVVTPPRRAALQEHRYAEQAVTLERGVEMGRFLLGSTVILLWPRATLAFNPDWAPGAVVRVGQGLGARVR